MKVARFRLRNKIEDLPFDGITEMKKLQLPIVITLKALTCSRCSMQRELEGVNNGFVISSLKNYHLS